MRKISAILFALITLLTNNAAYADWVDDYFDAAVTTSPTAYQGQQYGYYTGGGFSARLSHKSDPLMNIQLPSIKAGCGGIDVFWGGISFMNFDYLIKKAEGLLKNAPYVVFSIGLKALSTQFGETIETVQAIIDQLNQLQFDECSAAKDMVNYVMTGETPGIVKEINDIGTNAAKLGKGISKHWNNANKTTNDNSAGEKNKIVNSSVTDPIAKELLTGAGSVLSVLTDKGLITGSEASAIRALVGDVEYDNPKSSVSYFNGCAANMTFNQYINEQTPFQDRVNGACSKNTKSIKQRSDEYIATLITALTDDSKRKTALSNDLVSFIIRSDVPVFSYMSSASIAGADYLNATAPNVSSAVAAGYAYSSLSNLSRNVMSVIKGLGNNLAKEDQYVEFMVKALNSFNTSIQERMTSFQNEYSITISRLSQILTMAKQMEDMNKELYKIRQDSILITGKL